MFKNTKQNFQKFMVKPETLLSLLRQTYLQDPDSKLVRLVHQHSFYFYILFTSSFHQILFIKLLKLFLTITQSYFNYTNRFQIDSSIQA